MLKLLGSAALAAAVAGSLLTSAPTQAQTAHEPRQAQRGTTSLAEVLGADGQKFDQKWGDFDIVEAAAYAVLDAKPKSPVGVLGLGSERITAFVPTDKAFRALVQDLTGKRLASEKKVFKVVAGLGIDTVEAVLLYHVVPGATLTSDKVLDADGAVLTTASGGATLTVSVSDDSVKLIDNDPDAANAKVVVLDINRGNKQVAHGINKVLRPLDL